MPEAKTLALIAASLVIGVLVAPPLRKLLGWLMQTVTRLLLIAAVVAVAWLLVQPETFPLRRPTTPVSPAAPGPTWGE